MPLPINLKNADLFFAFFAILLFLLAELFVMPTGEFPLNDDWSYSHSVKYFLETGKTDIGYWPAMSLVSHIWWGSFFTWVFGFSHFSLRCSTIFIAVLSIIILSRLLLTFNRKPLPAFLLCLAIIFNPLWFLLSNTFMTDVPFLFSVLIAFYCLKKVFLENRSAYLYGFTFACVYSLLIRQFGLMLSASLFLTGLLLVILRQIKVNRFFIFSIPFIISLFAYFIFEKWLLHHLPTGAVYQSSVLMGEKNILDEIARPLVTRFSYCMLYTGLFLFPFCIAGAVFLFRSRTRKQIVKALPLFAVLLLFLFNRLTIFPNGNILYDTGLGGQNVYDIKILDINAGHSQTSVFMPLVQVIAALGALCFAWITAMELTRISGLLWKRQGVNHFKLFLVCFMLAYFICLCISDSFFDRYCLPLITTNLILLSGYFQRGRISVGVSAACILLLILFSVPATKDFFNWNKARWELIDRQIGKGIKPNELNGGFEFVAYTQYDDDWWPVWCGEGILYKVTAGPLPHHRRADFEVYTRMIPFKKDTLFLMLKE